MEADFTGQEAVLVVLIDAGNAGAQVALEGEEGLPRLIAAVAGIPQRLGVVIAVGLLAKLAQQDLAEPVVRLAFGLTMKP